jgi:hypothetical protein
MEEGCMPIREHRPHHRSRRLCALLVTCAVLGVGALHNGDSYPFIAAGLQSF